MKRVEISDEIIRLQAKIANDKEGRFIPYIGPNYQKGITLNTLGNQKILVIGPRHYCDARHDSRNLLCNLTSIQKEQLFKQHHPVFPDSLAVGCIQDKALECLKKKHDSCPVYRSPEYLFCPLSGKCKIKESFNCNEKRNLRCETLFAINDFLKPDIIESKKLGIIYFQTITEFINKIYKPVSEKHRFVWEHIAFMNLIQRYVPHMKIDETRFNNKDRKKFINGMVDSESLLANYIEREDVEFTLGIIKSLKPDIVILTMDCLYISLNRKLNGLYYTLEHRDPILKYYSFRKSNETEVDSVREKKVYQIIETIVGNYIIPLKTRQFAADLNKIIAAVFDYKILDMFNRHYKLSHIRKMIFESLIVKLKKNSSDIGTSILKLKWVDCAIRDNIDQNTLESFRIWLKQRTKDASNEYEKTWELCEKLKNEI